MRSSRAERRWLAAALGVGTTVCAAYLATAAAYAPGGGWSVPLRDAYLFFQYGAAWSAGDPYVFTPGDAPTTGSTSHLYPALLGLLHRLGARGDGLSIAAGLASAVSLLGCVALLWSLARRVAPGALPLAALLCATSGHLAATLFGGTDAVVSVPLALGCFAALAGGRVRWLAALLVLSALARPDGLVLSGALAAATLLPGARAGSPAPPGALRTAAALGAVAFAATLGLNAALTGSAVPDSVEGKGPFHDHSAAGALALCSRAALGLFVEIFLGIGDEVRRSYLLPLAGGALAALGFVERARRGEILERFVLLSGLGILAAGLVSGGSGIHRDRYLAWALPFLLLYAAAGARSLADRARVPGLFPALAAALLGSQLVGAVFLWSSVSEDHARTASSVRFVKGLADTLPPGARIGMTGGAGLAYFLPGHPVRNVNGIVSSAFAHPHPNVVGAEILLAHPELRFDYWLLRPADLGRSWIRPFLGRGIRGEPPEVSGARMMALYEADWSALESREADRDPKGAPPLARLEVGLPASEAEHDYRVWTRLPGVRLEPALVAGRLEGMPWADVGRVVRGGERFRLPAPASGRARLVMRTARFADAVVRAGSRVRGQRFTLDSPLQLVVRVGGEVVAQPRLPLEGDAGTIHRLPIVLATPAGAESLEVEIEGDYLSLGYTLHDAADPPR